MNRTSTSEFSQAPAASARSTLGRAIYSVKDVIREVTRMRREAEQRFPFLQV